MKLLRFWIGSLLLLALVTALVLAVTPALLERQMNRVIPHPAYEISPAAQELHQSLFIGDLHSDSTLWKRDLSQRADRGHIDIPRMREGNAALQMFTSTTRAPRGQNYDSNSDQAPDNITLLVLAQAWPMATWSSLTARALYQANKLKSLQKNSPELLQLVFSAADLKRLLARRENGEEVVGGLLGTEGSHALDGDLDNIKRLFEAGFRMMSLQHFFDNKLGGSLHGESGAGLTPFGEQAVDQMLQLGIMVDVSHSSPAVVRDVLLRSSNPLIVSHTGFYGHCQSPRNIPDELMQGIADAGGLIGVGFWETAVCDPSPAGIVGAIRYGIDLVGVDHIALGSDFDGGVAVSFDISEIAVLTQEMLTAGFNESEIRQVMGENMLRFLSKNLPPD